MSLVFLAGGGAVIGALLRYGIMQLFKPFNRFLVIPYSTLLINLSGSLALGWLTSTLPNQALTALLGAGVCGGFTTFSTLMNETDLLFRQKHPWRADAYLALSVLGGLLFAWLGALLGSNLF